MSSLLELLERDPSPRAGEIGATLGPMVDDIVRAFGAERAVVALVDPERRILRGAHGHGVPAELVEALEVPLTSQHALLCEVLRTGKPASVENVATDARLVQASRDVLVEMGFERFVVAPLITGDETVGVLVLGKSESFSAADVNALLPLASRAGAELARARDLGRLRDTGEAHAIEKEWLWWMINAVGDPVILSDEQNEIVLPNRPAELLFKADPEDSKGKQHAVTMNNFLFSALLSTLTLRERGVAEPRELTLVDPIEGSDIVFEVISMPAHNYRLGQRGIVSLLKNVTDLRRVGEELERSAQRLQSADVQIRMERDRLDLILRSVPNPIVVFDPDDQIITMNAAAQQVFGAPERGPVPETQPGNIATRNTAKFTAFIAQLRLEPGVRKVGELALLDPAGEDAFEMAVTATEIKDDVGAHVATVAVMQDVARLRELERRRMEQTLFESEKLAATGRLAASIAHEINNPLEAIQNSLYLLVKKVKHDDPNYKFLDIARRETERMSRILRQMLGFYRPVAEMVTTDLNALIDEAGALVAKRLRDRRVRLEKSLDPKLPAIRASADQLRQVILNLLLNASEAMPDGGTVTISTQGPRGLEMHFRSGDMVQIQVRDTGPGVDEEALARIFEPFFSTKGTKGTGLGLWVSRGIVQAHGGSLQVRSRRDGTVFTVTLPVDGPLKDADAVT